MPPHVSGIPPHETSESAPCSGEVSRIPFRGSGAQGAVGSDTPRGRGRGKKSGSRRRKRREKEMSSVNRRKKRQRHRRGPGLGRRDPVLDALPGLGAAHDRAKASHSRVEASHSRARTRSLDRAAMIRGTSHRPENRAENRATRRCETCRPVPKGRGERPRKRQGWASRPFSTCSPPHRGPIRRRRMPRGQPGVRLRVRPEGQTGKTGGSRWSAGPLTRRAGRCPGACR